MVRPLAAALAALCLAGSARAEIYRCADPDGSVRFTSDPRACERPVLHVPDPDLLRAGPTAPTRRAGAPAPRPHAADPERLAALLPPAPPGWEAMHEAPVAESDPALRAQGLRASAARHYSRARGAVSELCTVEIWSFAEPAQARAAQASLDATAGQVRPAGALLVLARGIRMERGVGARRGLVPGCAALAESVETRARAAAHPAVAPEASR